MTKVRYPAIDGLRCFSAIGIVMMHVRSNSYYQIDGFLFDWMIPSFTNLVYLFMIISSFCTCCGYYEKCLKNEMSLEKFYINRIKKIWPFFAFMSFLELGISPTFGHLCETFANLTMFFGFVDKEISVIGVGWFLGTTFIFYLIFPFFCYLISSKKRAWFSLGIALVLNLISHFYFKLGRSNFAYCAVYYLTGGILFLYKDRLSEFSRRYKKLTILLCTLSVGVYYFLGAYTPIFIILYSLCLIYALGSTRGLLVNKFTQYISDISMEIYLCHMAIFGVIERIYRPMLSGDSILKFSILYLITLSGAIVFSVIFNWMLNIVRKKYISTV